MALSETHLFFQERADQADNSIYFWGNIIEENRSISRWVGVIFELQVFGWAKRPTDLWLWVVYPETRPGASRVYRARAPARHAAVDGFIGMGFTEALR